MARSSFVICFFVAFNFFCPVIGQTIRATSDSKPYSIGRSGESQTNNRKDFALLIANESFADPGYSKLNNPRLDVDRINQILTQRFGFKTEVVFDITKDEFVRKIREYANLNYAKYDQLLVYFAGHGDFDPLLRQGYVVMKDSQSKDETYSKHLSFPELQNILSNMRCNHILLTLDVCYGGTFDNYFATAEDNMFRGVNPVSEKSRMQESLDVYMMEKLQPVTRLYMSAGGKEVVPDGKKGQHSPFARAFVSKLEEAASADYKVLTISGLKDYVEKETRKVKMGGFGNNQSNSDFLFVAN
jgi:hypothetical protein